MVRELRILRPLRELKNQGVKSKEPFENQFGLLRGTNEIERVILGVSGTRAYVFKFLYFRAEVFL